MRRRVLREVNLDSRARAGVGIEFLKEPERLSERLKDYDRTVRRTRRVFVGVGLIETEKLSDIERRKADVLRRVTSAQLEAGIEGKKELALRPTPQNPKRLQ